MRVIYECIRKKSVGGMYMCGMAAENENLHVKIQERKIMRQLGNGIMRV
jgi:hypothetical protein